MRRVLIVAYYFPPIAATGAMRPLGFARYLDRYGWSPRIVSTTSDSVYPKHGRDERLALKLPPGVTVTSIPYSNPLDRLLIFRRNLLRVLGLGPNRDSGVRASAPQTSPSSPIVQPKRGMTGQFSRLMLDWAFAFPDPPQSIPAAATRRNW